MKLPIAVVVGVLCCLQLTYGQTIEPVTLTSMDVITITLDVSSIIPTPTMSPPTPTPTSTPTPPPHRFRLHSKNATCAILEADIKLTLNYKSDRDNKKNIRVNVPVNDMDPYLKGLGDDDECPKNILNMMFEFSNNSVNHTITFTFNRTNSKDYDLKEVSVVLNTSDSMLFPDFDKSSNITGNTDRKNGLFSVSYKKSYRCNKSQKYTMKGPLDDVDIELGLSNFQAQAFEFNNDTTTTFDKAVDCSADQKSSKVVPIAVGAALAGLVVVVLIAYLIGRFRSRKQNSYEALS